MKKTLSLLLVLVMVLSLFAGCGNNEKPVESQPAESQPVESQPVESQPVESQPAEDVEKTLTIGLTTDVTPLSCIDPSNGEVAGLILQIMYPGYYQGKRERPGGDPVSAAGEHLH